MAPLVLPSNYSRLKEIRAAKNVKLKKCSYIKENVQLRNYQAIGTYHIIASPRMVLGDDTGLGKTVQSLSAYCYIKEQNPDFKLIVIAPKSSLFQWKAEVEKFLIGISAEVITAGPYKLAPGKYLTGAKSREYQFKQVFEKNTDLMIMNYHTLMDEYQNQNLHEMFHKNVNLKKSYESTGKTIPKDLLEFFIKNPKEPKKSILYKKLDKYMVIFDEASSFKNYKTWTFRAVEYTSIKAQRALALTATIIKNKLEEAFSIYKAILPGLFKNITEFRRRYCHYIFLPMKSGRKIPKLVGYKNLAQFRVEIDPYFLGRKKEHVATELPKLISKEIRLEMYLDQDKTYKSALEGLLELDSGESKKVDRLSALIYCQQISDSPSIVGISNKSSKEDELFRLLEEELEDEKVIIYTTFKKMIDRFEELFKKKKIKMTRITGAETAKQRETNKQKFQDINSGVNVIFINSAGSMAINLQSASTFIFYDNPWSYGDYLQLVGRAQRIGNERSSILVLHLINTGTIDQYVLKTLKAKQGLINTIFGESTTGELDFEDVTDSLFKDMVQDIKNEQMV